MTSVTFLSHPLRVNIPHLQSHWGQPYLNINITRRKCVPCPSPRHFVVAAKSTDSTDENVPSWAKPDSDEPPPWARSEGNSGTVAQSEIQIPFYVYLLSSAITAIAAIGSIFEYVNQRPIFGVVNSDNVLYAPILGFFVFTGIPSAAFLWFKSVQVANKEAEEQDKRDGYL